MNNVIELVVVLLSEVDQCNHSPNEAASVSSHFWRHFQIFVINVKKSNLFFSSFLSSQKTLNKFCIALWTESYSCNLLVCQFNWLKILSFAILYSRKSGVCFIADNWFAQNSTIHIVHDVIKLKPLFVNFISHDTRHLINTLKHEQWKPNNVIQLWFAQWAERTEF